MNSHAKSLNEPTISLAEFVRLNNDVKKPKKHLSLVQNGVEKYGITTDLLQKNVNFYDIKGKMLFDNKFKNSQINVISVDSMLDEDQGPSNFEKEITSHYGGFY